MNRLRVMHLVVAGDIGGAERLLTELASRPQRTGADHEVALITPNRRLADYFVAAGLKVHDRGPASESPLATLRRAFGRSDVQWLQALFAERRTDVVHTHTLGSHVLGTRAALQARLPQVRTEHHVMHYRDPTSSPFTRWAAARTDRFVAVSEYVKAVIAKTAPDVAARMAVVRNGVDAAYWNPRPALQAGFRLGICCRLTAWKRVEIAVEAAARAGAELIVVGDGEERRALEARAAKLGGVVRFVGHQRDPRPFIADCSVTLSTADREPLGLSVLESLAMKRPVIAYRGGGIPEIVEDGVSGVLVSELSPDAFASAIGALRVQPDRLDPMGAAGRRFAETQGHIDRTSEGYAAVYASLRKHDA
jgi:glycosyltransferase involved in cell wall biosynthesis